MTSQSALRAAQGVFISAVLLRLALLLRSSGKPIPFRAKNGRPLKDSISEKLWLEINGAEQGMFIKGKSIANPVLLYLHGGMPDYFLTQTYPTGLEEYFTVVWWERRGSGLSYRPGTPLETLTLERFVSDTLELTNYLRQHFGQEKIYIMGHSGGTFIGIQAAARAPELYHAYIGVAQMVNQRKSEQLAYDYMLERFKANGNTNMVRKLQAAPVTIRDGTPPRYLALRDQAMHSLGIGTTHDMTSIVSGLFLPSLACREYTLLEKLNTWRAKKASGTSLLWDEMLGKDLSTKLTELHLPVYLLHGIHDYTCSYTEAKAYSERLKAPMKGFYTFERSAHSPIFEEPEKALRIMREDVRTGTNTLADPTSKISASV